MRFLVLKASVAILGMCSVEAFLPPTTRLTQAHAACRHQLAAYSGRSTATMRFKSPLDVLKQGIARAGAGPYDKDKVQRAVTSYKSDNKVVVFSWTRCPFCKKAKGLLADLIEDPSDYKFVELDQMDEGNAIRYELSQDTGRTSVPQIWIGGEFVGGCNDGPGVFTLEERGELVPMLKAAGCTVKGA